MPIAEGFESGIITGYSGWDGEPWMISFHNAVLKIDLGPHRAGDEVEIEFELPTATWRTYDAQSEVIAEGGWQATPV